MKALAKLAWAALALGAAPALAQSLSPIETLGKFLLFDARLSMPPGQSCAACHAPETGFTGPSAAVNTGGAVYAGAIPARFGNRKPPTVAYGGDSPVLYYDADKQAWIGGMFWDGRATGWTLGDPLAEQALGPFLNPLEQNNPNARMVVHRVAMSPYAALFEQVWGDGSLSLRRGDASGAYERIGRAIAAYERSAEVNPFSSKYDHYLRGQATLTAQETSGLALFEGKARCSACHPSRPVDGKPPLFTDFTYDNLGLPKNPLNPFYAAAPKFNRDGTGWIDPGLGGFLKTTGYSEAVYQAEWGKHKVPTLRNVDRRPEAGFVKAFGHNGVFKSIEEIVDFYNTRDVAAWPPPEVALNVNTQELGNLGLTAQEVADIVAFLKTLTDGYSP